jgi:sugar lactone lactonase YvrE
MSTLNFPNSPSLNDTYTFGTKTWVWNGAAWQLQSSGAINNIPVGNVTPSTGAFTTITADSTISAVGNITGATGTFTNRLGVGTTSPEFNVHVVGNVDPVAFSLDGYGSGNPAFITRKALGTVEEPTALLLNSPLFTFGARGYSGSAFTSFSSVAFVGRASENWTPTATGSKLEIGVIKNGTTTRVNRLVIENDGQVSLNANLDSTSTTSGTLLVTGGIGATGNVTAGNVLGTTGAFTTVVGNANATSLTSGTVPSARLSGSYTINISGAATTAGTVTTAAQPNITSVGTLSSLLVSTATGRVGIGTDSGGSLTIGRIDGTASSPYIDFNSSATVVDYDFRLSTTGNTGVTGQGNLTFQGGNVIMTSPVVYLGTASATGNITGGNISTAGLITATGNIRGGNVVAVAAVSAATVTATSNITGGNISTAGQVTATGNVTTANAVVFSASTDYIAATSSVESWYYEADFSVAAQDTEPRCVTFSSDGTKMYVAGNAGDDVNQYNLGTAWDITTAVYNSAFVVSAQETTITGVTFKTDGTVMYVVGTSSDAVHSYNLGTPWLVTTAVFANTFSVAAEETSPQAVEFSTDGTKMYVMGDTGDDINQYNLGTAWNITTAVYSTVFSVSAYENSPQGLAFSPDGTRMWIVGSTFARLVEYTLSTPWSIATAVFSDLVIVSNLGTYALTGISGLYVNLAQNKAYISDYGTDRIFQLKTNLPATKLYGSKWVVQPDLMLESDLIVDRNSRVNGNIFTPLTVQGGTGSFSTGSFTSLTISTGTVNLGANTATHTSQFAYGATANAATKTVNIGTGGVAGSTTNINLGSVAGSGNIVMNNSITNGQANGVGNIGTVSNRFNTVFAANFVGNGSQLTGLPASGITWTTQANTPPVTAAPGDFWYNSTTQIRYQYTNTGTGNVWVDLSNPTVFNSITAGQILNANANGVGNIGSAGASFNTVFAKATSAQYADLAEIYQADADYPPGTVVIFGGNAEITQSYQTHDTRVAGVVSTNPAFLMNSECTGLPVAMTGRVPCQVQGPINKGDLLVTSNVLGTAQRLYDWNPGCVIGKSLETIQDNSVKIIEVVVGRF